MCITGIPGTWLVDQIGLEFTELGNNDIFVLTPTFVYGCFFDLCIFTEVRQNKKNIALLCIFRITRDNEKFQHKYVEDLLKGLMLGKYLGLQENGLFIEV